MSKNNNEIENFKKETLAKVAELRSAYINHFSDLMESQLTLIATMAMDSDFKQPIALKVVGLIREYLDKLQESPGLDDNRADVIINNIAEVVEALSASRAAKVPFLGQLISKMPSRLKHETLRDSPDLHEHYKGIIHLRDIHKNPGGSKT